jgi:BirA family biotin operon repressor/biotin-[acetyl-CoA-carboxylase] ligase
LCHELDRLLPGATAQLKWPNDVHVAGRKLAGILVETVPGGATAPRLVLGMGINVNNSLRNAPPELQGTACALVDILGGPEQSGGTTTTAGSAVDSLRVLCGWMREFTELAQGLAQGDPLLPEGWRQRCPLAGRQVSLQAGDRTVSGLCLGIDDSGALLVETPSGTERCFGGVLVRVQA